MAVFPTASNMPTKEESFLKISSQALGEGESENCTQSLFDISSSLWYKGTETGTDSERGQNEVSDRRHQMQRPGTCRRLQLSARLLQQRSACLPAFYPWEVQKAMQKACGR